MLEAPHVLLGVAIASKAVHPALAIPLSFGSHFVLDMVPHWNPHLNTEMRTYGKVTKQTKFIIYADLALSVLITLYFASRALPNQLQAANIALSATASILPDLIEAPYFFFKIKTGILESWIRFQKSIQSDAEPIVGIITQIAIMAASIWWIFS